MTKITRPEWFDIYRSQKENWELLKQTAKEGQILSSEIISEDILT